jgi:hypothetical protein
VAAKKRFLKGLKSMQINLISENKYIWCELVKAFVEDCLETERPLPMGRSYLLECLFSVPEHILPEDGSTIGMIACCIDYLESAMKGSPLMGYNPVTAHVVDWAQKYYLEN